MSMDGEGISSANYGDWKAALGTPGLWCYRSRGLFYIYTIGAESRPGGSDYPPPSVQNRDVVRMYAGRDGWVCHLCGGQIVDVAGKHAPSVDHLAPRVQGGSDYPTNLRAAHLSCNKSRGSRAL